jgi:hypothetical protein
MHEQNNLVLCEDVVVSESALLRRERKNRYGGVPGLDESELADPDELERQVLREEFGPVLALPASGSKLSIRPSIDQDGSVDWGAFGTVDFDRYSGRFDKVRYKAEKVAEQLKDLLILFGIVNERIKTRAKYIILMYLKKGVIELEHIENSDILALAKLYLRIQKMRKEIAELREASERRRQRQVQVSWLSL